MDETGFGNDLTFYLRRFNKRLRLRDGWLKAQQTLWLAGLAGLLVQTIGRLWPVENIWVWTLLPVFVWLLAAIAYTIFKPQTMMQIARRVDLELNLKERLSTALASQTAAASQSARRLTLNTRLTQPASQFSLAAQNLSRLQKSDALAMAAAIVPAQAFALQWMLRSLGVATMLIFLTLASMVIPNPQVERLAQKAAIEQAAKEQAKQIETARQEIEQDQKISPEMRDELARQLEELAKKLQRNPGDLEQALADLTRLEQELKRKLDPNLASRQAMLETLAAQLARATGERNSPDAIQSSEQALERLAKQMEQMDEAQRQQLAQSLAQAAAQSAQTGDGQLSQALAALAQAVQSGDAQAVSKASQDVQSVLAGSETQMADQMALQRSLAQANASRQALAQTGRQVAQANANPGQANPGNLSGAAQAGGQRVSGGGTKANQLPPATGGKRSVDPQGNAPNASITPLDNKTGFASQVYTPWQKTANQAAQIFIPGQETQQGQTTSTESNNPLPGIANPALTPYNQVFYNYMNTAAQAIGQSNIPSNLLDYVRLYFSSLEP